MKLHHSLDLININILKTTPNYGLMRWFALGSKYTGTHPHFDPYKTDAWNSVVHGMKWWMLFPSTVQMEEDKYGSDDDADICLGCDESCSDDHISILRYFSSMWRNPPLDLLQRESIQHVFLKEGETLFVPRGMIHRWESLLRFVFLFSFSSFSNSYLAFLFFSLINENNQWK